MAVHFRPQHLCDTERKSNQRILCDVRHMFGVFQLPGQALGHWDSWKNENKVCFLHIINVKRYCKPSL